MKILELDNYKDTYAAVLDRNNIAALLDYSHPDHSYKFSAYFPLNARTAIKLSVLDLRAELFLGSKLSDYLP